MRVGAVWGDVCGGRVWICVRCAHVWVCMCVAGVVCLVWFVVCVGGTGVHVYMCSVQGCEHMFMYGVWSCVWCVWIRVHGYVEVCGVCMYIWGAHMHVVMCLCVHVWHVCGLCICVSGYVGYVCNVRVVGVCGMCVMCLCVLCMCTCAWMWCVHMCVARAHMCCLVVRTCMYGMHMFAWMCVVCARV